MQINLNIDKCLKIHVVLRRGIAADYHGAAKVWRQQDWIFFYVPCTLLYQSPVTGKSNAVSALNETWGSDVSK